MITEFEGDPAIRVGKKAITFWHDPIFDRSKDHWSVIDWQIEGSIWNEMDDFLLDDGPLFTFGPASMEQHRLANAMISLQPGVHEISYHSSPGYGYRGRMSEFNVAIGTNTSTFKATCTFDDDDEVETGFLEVENDDIVAMGMILRRMIGPVEHENVVVLANHRRR